MQRATNEPDRPGRQPRRPGRKTLLQARIAAFLLGTVALPAILEGCLGNLQRELEVLLAFESAVNTPLLRDSILFDLLRHLSGL